MTYFGQIYQLALGKPPLNEGACSLYSFVLIAILNLKGLSKVIRVLFLVEIEKNIGTN